MCSESAMQFRLLSFYTLLYRNKSKLSISFVNFFTMFIRYSESVQIAEATYLGDSFAYNNRRK